MSKIICIDPGHGGKDPGGGSNSQFLEKNMVLDISKEQKKHFERNGIKVVMTRTTDEYLDSVPRTNRVKNSGAKYCISNHVNAAGGKGEGAETIHSIHSNGKVAEGILKALVALGAKYRRFFSRKGSNGDWYFMHRMTGSVSTVIVEYGFADHPSDSKKIIKDWKKYAEAVARYYIENVFNQKYIAPGKTEKPKPKPEKPTPAPKPKPSEYKGSSIVDYLKSIGESSSSANRRKLAKEYGVKGYDLSAKKNTELLNKMRKGKPATKPTPAPKPKPKKSVAQMAKEVIAGKHGNGHANRRKSLGISQAEYNKVRAAVNKGAGSSKPKKSISQMATEVIAGKHGNGHANRRKSLGISQAEYNKVRAAVNKRA